MTGKGGIVEIQGTAEKDPFTQDQLLELLTLARNACDELKQAQDKVIASLG